MVQVLWLKCVVQKSPNRLMLKDEGLSECIVRLPSSRVVVMGLSLKKLAEQVASVHQMKRGPRADSFSSHPLLLTSSLRCDSRRELLLLLTTMTTISIPSLSSPGRLFCLSESCCSTPAAPSGKVAANASGSDDQDEENKKRLLQTSPK